MYGKDLPYCAVDVVLTRRAVVLDIDREGSAWDDELWCATIKLREPFRVHSSGRDNQLKVSPACNDFLDQAHKNVGIESTFMGFVCGILSIGTVDLMSRGQTYP
jgi:hypothetical protein